MTLHQTVDCVNDISSYIAHLHSIAAKGPAGLLTMVAKTPDGSAPAFTQRFLIGDEGAAAMVAFATEHRTDRDVQIPLAVFRPDLAAGSGREPDLVAVLGTMLDDDSKAMISPVPTSYVWHSSSYGRHQVILFDEPVTDLGTAKQVAIALAEMTGSGTTKSLVSARRIPGTFNHKRSMPELVALESTGPEIAFETLRTAVAHLIKPLAEPKPYVPPTPADAMEIAKFKRAIETIVANDPEHFADRDRTGAGRENRRKKTFAMWRAGFPEDRAREIAALFCNLNKSQKRRGAEGRFEAYWAEAGEGTYHIASVYHEAYKHGFEMTTEEKRAAAIALAPKPDFSNLPLAPPPLLDGEMIAPAPLPAGAAPMMGNGASATLIPRDSEDSMADDLVSVNEASLRYCEDMKQWFLWNGVYWFRDKTSTVYSIARKHVRTYAAVAKDARKLTKASTIAAVESLARRDQRIATTADMWDNLLNILNTPAGPIDLKTGSMLPIDPAMLLSKTTSIAPHGDCPMFKKFLNEAMGGDQEKVEFLQRICGCALSGEVRDHVIFFLYGPGGRGKGVFMNTVSRIFGDYRKTMMQETITERGPGHDRHPTEIASLKGARLVTVSEIEKGRRWAESRLKGLTGGDEISARVISGNPFEFFPQLTLIIAGNHKPSLSSVGDEIRRRFHLIPFNCKPAVVDVDLTKKLEAEHAGILAWMIDGAVKWYQDGLRVPQSIKEATNEYLEAEDGIGAWLDEKCERTGNSADIIGRNELFQSWCRWAEASREPIGNSRQFYEALRQQHEIEEGAVKGKRGFRGIKFKPVEMPPTPPR